MDKKNKIAKYLAIIPARGGSKGVPQKNIRNLAGKPLIAWTIEQCLSCDLIEKTIVSTDDDQIASISRRYGAEVPFIRPEELARDETPTEPVLKHAVNWFESIGESFDAIILMQPTSPIRHKSTIKNAIKEFEEKRVNSLVTVCDNHSFFWKNLQNPEPLYNYKSRPRRQDIKEEDRWYRETGSIYITRTQAFLSQNNRLCDPIGVYVMRDDEGYEIDSLTDFEIVESLIANIF
jgi:CMP-N,N'-diacetyllegionaminic acid synthase